MDITSATKHILIQWGVLVSIIVALCITPNLASSARDKGYSQAPGVAVDSRGGSAIDPTSNVKELVEANSRRQDDLRLASEKYIEAEARHLRDMAELRAKYDQLLRDIDTVRQEKVREVDVLGARTETERAQAAVKALAEMGTTTADTLRKTVETTATTMAAQLDMKFAESNKRLAAVEQALSEGRGKQTLSDPMVNELATEIKHLRELQSEGAGKGAGMDKLFQYIVTGIGLLASMGLGIYITRKKNEGTS
jgi:hypothetical protein